MTVKELSGLRFLKREVTVERERLAVLCSRSEYGQSPRLGEVKSGGVSDRTANYAVEIAYLKKLIAENMKRCICEALRLQSFIDSIEDPELRLIFKERFIRCRSWRSVALLLDSADEQIPRRKVDRFLKEYNEGKRR